MPEKSECILEDDGKCYKRDVLDDMSSDRNNN